MAPAELKTDAMSLILDSSFAEVDRGCENIRAFLSERGLENDIFELLLIIREGLINAVEHGNGFDEQKQVQVHLELAAGEARVIISDQGTGFDTTQQEDREPDPELPRGRGLVILRQYADQIRFNREGNQLTLKKCLKSKGRNS